MSPPTAWTHLIRFVAADDGKTYAGQLIDTSAQALGTIGAGTEAYVIKGNILEGAYEVTGDKKNVGKLLCPFEMGTVPIVRCVGLNYAKHVKEGSVTSHVPQWPTLFIKPRTSLADPSSDILIPKCAQDGSLDYEAELVFVLSKSGKSIHAQGSDWKDYILGYTAGNDLSWRRAQVEPSLSGTQWCLGKGLDGFAPLGPVLVSSKVLDPSDLSITLKVNGETKQSARTSDMVHKVPDILARFSDGTTLEKGSVVMSGTPNGVGYFQNPRVYLKDGDQVEIEIDGVGVLRHGIRYA